MPSVLVFASIDSFAETLHAKIMVIAPTQIRLIAGLHKNKPTAMHPAPSISIAIAILSRILHLFHISMNRTSAVPRSVNSVIA